MLDLDAVTARYPGQTRPALKAVSLRVRPGELIAVVGHNGAGKTTLFDIVAGLRRPCAGRVRRGFGTAELGWSPQRDVIDWSLTVEQNIALPLRLRGWRGSEARAEVHRVARVCGVADVLNRVCEELSGGQLRRCQNARAIAGYPRLFLLDEPTTGLDPDAIGKLYEFLSCAVAAGSSALVSTHETTRFATVCTRVIALDSGTLIADQTTALFLGSHSQNGDLWAAYSTIVRHGHD